MSMEVYIQSLYIDSIKRLEQLKTDSEDKGGSKMWKCRECNGEVLAEISEKNSCEWRMDIYGNIVSRLKTESVESEIEFYICTSCNEFDYYLSDIATWDEESSIEMKKIQPRE